MEVFEVVDLFILEGGDREKRITRQLLDSGKEAVYNCPLMIGANGSPHNLDAAVVQRTLRQLYVHIDRAKALGAKKAIVASGEDPGPGKREESISRFIDFLSEACAYAAQEPSLELIIEPFDRGIGKNLLIGPSLEALYVVEQVKQRGFENIGIALDMGHVPLMEESFEHATATLGPHIRHVHLGNCCMKDPSNPLYGDMHPPWGYPGGEHDVPELTRFLKCLFAAGYLGEGKRPTVTMEMRPYDGLTEEDSVHVFLDKLNQAWAQLEVIG